MELIQKQPVRAVIVSFVFGTLFGLIVFGWWLLPVEWTDAGPEHLHPDNQAIYIKRVAQAYSNDPGKDRSIVTGAIYWTGARATVCQLANASTDPLEQAQLNEVAIVLNGQQCDGTAVAPEATTGDAQSEQPQDEGASSLLIPVLIVALVVVVALIILVMNRRNAMMADEPVETFYDMPESAPTVTGDVEVGAAIPLARFQSSYGYGRDNYDDSFSIENTNGDFLGECGVGISESIGTDTPRNVTAFEVWLFDKNDIRTETKVVMSDHAFFDEALKAKLAPKGEPVLARENEVIVLETASLIINAEIKELQYGTGVLPPQSFFDNFTIELSAWAKEGDFGEPNVQGRVDELLEY